MKIRDPLILALAAVAAGCGAQMTAPQSAANHRHQSERYRLYTHCGVQWAKIDGTCWRATQPLSDGNGNPPPGWGNPFQTGTLTLSSRTTAEFKSAAGSVIFRRTERTQPPVVCS